MGHEVIIYGTIEGATFESSRYRLLQDRNATIIQTLPAEDDFPWLTRSMFALPGPNPQGTYRTQVIHFGLSLKDDPPRCPTELRDPVRGWPKSERRAIYEWLAKFEQLLATLYWFAANVYFSTDFEPAMHVFYLPTNDAIDSMICDEPEPIAKWNREIHFDRS